MVMYMPILTCYSTFGWIPLKLKGNLFRVISNYVIVLKKLTYNSKMLRLKNEIELAVIFINLL